jgi:hypothetical protein
VTWRVITKLNSRKRYFFKGFFLDFFGIIQKKNAGLFALIFNPLCVTVVFGTKRSGVTSKDRTTDLWGHGNFPALQHESG